MKNLIAAVERLVFGATAEERATLENALIDRRVEARQRAMVDDLEAHFEEDVAKERIAANLSSIAEMPAADLPSNAPATHVLTWLIQSGYDVYCYWSGGRIYGTPIVWLQPLADVRPERDGRVQLADWCASWHELLGEMGLSAVADVAAAEGRVRA